MFGYSGALRSITQGKGEFSMEFSRYTPTRPDVQSKLIEDYRQELERAAATGGKTKKKKK